MLQGYSAAGSQYRSVEVPQCQYYLDLTTSPGCNDGDVKDQQEPEEPEVGSDPGPEATFDGLDAGSPNGQGRAPIPLLLPEEDPILRN